MSRLLVACSAVLVLIGCEANSQKESDGLVSGHVYIAIDYEHYSKWIDTCSSSDRYTRLANTDTIVLLNRSDSLLTFSVARWGYNGGLRDWPLPLQNEGVDTLTCSFLHRECQSRLGWSIPPVFASVDFQDSTHTEALRDLKGIDSVLIWNGGMSLDTLRVVGTMENRTGDYNYFEWRNPGYAFQRVNPLIDPQYGQSFSGCRIYPVE